MLQVQHCCSNGTFLHRLCLDAIMHALLVEIEKSAIFFSRPTVTNIGSGCRLNINVRKPDTMSHMCSRFHGKNFLVCFFGTVTKIVIVIEIYSVWCTDNGKKTLLAR